MKLLIIRHGKAMEREEWAKDKKPDADRPLTPDGIEEFSMVAKALETIVPPIDFIFSSPFKRTRQTADILHDVFPDAKLDTTDVLLQGTAFKEFHTFLSKLEWAKDSVICVIGHENHLSTILANLITCTNADAVRFKKGAAAFVDLTIVEGKISGQLLWFIPPKAIGRLTQE